jgi:two-component system response regulator GlrR
MPDDPRTTEALTQSVPARAHVRECRLTPVEGERDGAPFLFAAERMVIGADPRADLVIADPAMSKFHCEIRITDGAAVVRDLGSRNGTFVDRVAVIEAPLGDGALLSLGRTQLRFNVGTRHVEIALSARERFGRLVGRSLAMRALFAVLEPAAASATTILLQGESGTGKISPPSRSTSRARGATARSSSSTVARSRATCSRPSCSGGRPARSPAPRRSGSARSRPRAAAR